ncbi:NTP pyrophosphatase, house-cleaning of non-canonical NTPs [Halomicrobium zhouii]|uniref:NTP pyrophosphatase, house-cleaning of non-canonical NTPs n=1 Tax=Halomicrobium zhouii TaxID=767519 RepID=A0A1I6LIB1_9EURY|nr:MazG-like family protein [Halomicrobium zhouii]SFS03146.1 NTP pyrophosphatase, house-cleaning of non-canonical NTPs [Halomicrobium zhouii]
MDAQDRVSAFLDEHDLESPIAYRLLDLTSELGELAKEANESTGYGEEPADVELSADELGDALFSLLALCEQADVDAEDALAGAIGKYERRLTTTGSAGSGE